MKIDSKSYRLPPGKKVDLGKWPTIVDPYYKSKEQYRELLQQHMEKLSSLQGLHYASNRYALLLIFQGMDGAGKDGSPKSSNTIFSGAQLAAFPNAAESESSTALITRTCWSFGFIRSSCKARDWPKSCVIRKTSGPKGTNPSTIWRSIFIATEQRPSKYFCICPARSNESGSLHASTRQTRTGSSARPTFTKGNIGSAT